jgi:hypothetical protein
VTESATCDSKPLAAVKPGDHVTGCYLPIPEPLKSEPEAEPDEYTCPKCQRGKHPHCSDPECACCLGNPEE